MRLIVYEVGGKATQKIFLIVKLSIFFKTQHFYYTFLRAKEPWRNLNVGIAILKSSIYYDKANNYSNSFKN